MQARVVAVSAIVDTYFQGQVGTLDAIAQARAVVDQRVPALDAFLERLAPPRNRTFSGGIGWVDRSGTVRASSKAGRRPVDVSDRLYFRRVLATGSPYVSAGLVGRQNRQPVVVVALPTFDRHGDPSGALVGSLLLNPLKENRQAIDLGYGDLQVIDREGRLLFGGLAPVANRALLEQLRGRPSGVRPSTRGLDGQGDDVVAFATS